MSLDPWFYKAPQNLSHSALIIQTLSSKDQIFIQSNPVFQRVPYPFQ
jgi:hypothetical protein